MLRPGFTDSDAARRARLLLIILLTLLAVAFVLALPALLLPTMQPLLPLSIGFGLALCLLLAALRLGYVRSAAAGLIAVMIVIRLAAAALPDVAMIPGVATALVMDSAIIILLASFLFAWWSSVPVALAIVVGQLLVGAMLGPSVIEGGPITAGTLFAFCVFVSLFARSLGRALAYAQQQESAAQAAAADTQALNGELESTLRETQALLAQERTLRDTINQLTVPIQEVGHGVLFAPLIGHIDTQRGEQISKALLDQIHSSRSRTLILDVQGISVVDSGVVTLLDRLIRAAQLLGTRVMMTGVSAVMAATMTRLGITFANVSLHATVADALQIATVQAERASQQLVVGSLSNGARHGSNGLHFS